MLNFLKTHRLILPEKVEKYLFISLMAIAFLTYGSRYQAPVIIPEAIAVIIFVYTFIKYIQTKHMKKETKFYKLLILLYFIPVLIIHLYSIFMMMLGVMNKSYLSTNISAYAPVLIALSSIYLFKADALKYIFIAIVSSWTITLLSSIILHGIGVIPFAIGQGYFNNTNPILGVSTNYLELHDMVLTLGIFVILLFFAKNKMSKKDLAVLAIICLIIGLGIKRIAIPGIILSLVFVFFAKSKERIATKYSYVVSLIIFVGSFIFLYLVFSGKFTEIANSINLMGRNYYYDVISQYGSLSPLFLGTGRNSVSAILNSQHAYLHVSGVHSDILKMFIENGFIMFTIWLSYYLFILPKQLQKNFGKKTMLLYIATAIYTFTLYLTDNVENYFIYQIVFVTVPCCYYLAYRQQASQNNRHKGARSL